MTIDQFGDPIRPPFPCREKKGSLTAHCFIFRVVVGFFFTPYLVDIILSSFVFSRSRCNFESKSINKNSDFNRKIFYVDLTH